MTQQAMQENTIINSNSTDYPSDLLVNDWNPDLVNNHQK